MTTDQRNKKPIPKINRDDKKSEEPTYFDYFKAMTLYVPDEVSPVTLVGRAIVYILFFIWGWTFILHSVESNYVAESFMHNINLVFHEAGHIIFSPFGRFMTVLGGTLSQLLMPAIVMGAFLITNRNPFAASIGLWWLGQNFMDIAPYINDARDLRLPLLGGVTGRDVADYHDWEYLLGRLGLLEQDHFLAQMSQYFGILLMLTAFVWGAYMLYRQYRARGDLTSAA